MAVFAQIEFVYPMHQLIQVILVVEHETCLEISLVGVFCPHTSAGQVGGPDEGFYTVNDDCLGVYSWTQDTLEQLTLDQSVKTIKIFTKPWSGLLGVNESYCDTRLHESAENFQKGLKTVVVFDMQILYIGGNYPQEPFGHGQFRLYESGVDISVEQ